MRLMLALSLSLSMGLGLSGRLVSLCIINVLMSIIRTVCHEIYAHCLARFQFSPSQFLFSLSLSL